MIQTEKRPEIRVSDFVWATVPKDGRRGSTVVEIGLLLEDPDCQLYKVRPDGLSEAWVARRDIIFMHHVEKFKRGERVFHYLHGVVSVLGCATFMETQEADLIRIKTADGVLLECVCSDLCRMERGEIPERWRMQRMKPEDLVFSDMVEPQESRQPSSLLCHDSSVLTESLQSPVPVGQGDEVVVMCGEDRLHPGMIGRVDRFFSQGRMCVVKAPDGEVQVETARLRKLEKWGLRFDEGKVTDSDLPYHGHKA